MRKIVAGLFVSLDGVVESPDKWVLPYFNDEVGAGDPVADGRGGHAAAGAADLRGVAAYWPNQTSDVQFADWTNNTPKLAVSTTLKTVETRR